MSRIDKHCRLKEARSERMKQDPAPVYRSGASGPGASRQVNNIKEKKPPRPEECTAIHTVFTMPIYALIRKIEKEDFFRWPAKIEGEPRGRNASMRCSYHRDRGHLTTRCKALKAFLEEQVQAGRLQEFIDHMRTAEKLPDAPARDEEEVLPIINMIHRAMSAAA